MLWCNKELKFAYRKRRCLLNSKKTPCTTGPHAKEQKKKCRVCNKAWEKKCMLREWSQWSTCTITCSTSGEKGKQFRSREKKDDSTSCPPKLVVENGKFMPNPMYSQTRKCEVKPCPSKQFINAFNERDSKKFR